MSKWIASLGEFKVTQSENPSPELVKMEAELEWITDSNLTEKLTSQLLENRPDIYLTPTIKGIKEGKDELLDKAIEIINQKQ